MLMQNVKILKEAFHVHVIKIIHGMDSFVPKQILSLV